MSANKKLKAEFATPFWNSVREAALDRIRNNVKDNGALNWQKLPDLLGNNPKVEKGEKAGYATAIMHLSPSFAAGFNTCPFASLGCGMSCLNEAGHGQKHMMQNGKHAVHIARAIRTILYFKYRDQFIARLNYEIGRHKTKAEQMGLIPAVRLNGTSDIIWEKYAPELFANHRGVMFYDYTKQPGRKVEKIPNYSLTFSLNEANLHHARAELKRGVNVAAVFRLKPGNKNKAGEPLPRRAYLGNTLAPVIDGDVTDVRFTDPAPVIVGLRAKGDAYRDDTGFVLEPVDL